jgi:hypothetical protein
MAALDSPLIDRPRGVTFAMMDLFKRDAASPARACSMASAWASASLGSGSRGSTSTRTQRGAIPDATKMWASATLIILLISAS